MLYAKNLQNFLDLVISKEGTLAVNWEDEIIKETLVARDGKIVHRLLLAQGAQAS
jgi:NAD(P) transhydrogenase subunit alpha